MGCLNLFELEFVKELLWNQNLFEIWYIVRLHFCWDDRLDCYPIRRLSQLLVMKHLTQLGMPRTIWRFNPQNHRKWSPKGGERFQSLKLLLSIDDVATTVVLLLLYGQWQTRHQSHKSHTKKPAVMKPKPIQLKKYTNMEEKPSLFGRSRLQFFQLPTEILWLIPRWTPILPSVLVVHWDQRGLSVPTKPVIGLVPGRMRSVSIWHGQPLRLARHVNEEIGPLHWLRKTKADYEIWRMGECSFFLRCSKGGFESSSSFWSRSNSFQHPRP